MNQYNPNLRAVVPLSDVQGSDFLNLFAQKQGGWAGMSLTVLQEYMQANLTFESVTATTQRAAPSSTGFSVTVAADNTWLILTPTAGFADGTIVLPSAPANGSVVLVNTTQSVSALVVDGAGKTVTGEPTSLAADSFFRMKYDDTTAAWYRIG